MNIKNEILALLNSLNCIYTIKDGIITVNTPLGEKWDFTVPEKVY